MRLLIVTQAVDTEDQTLGFFHGWLKEFSKHFETIEVICLKEGKHALPSNVRIHSLGKERGVSRFGYLIRFYRYIVSLPYDAVFVHMNQEYVLLGALVWLANRRRVVLWRNHKKGSHATFVASRLARTVCYTSPDSYVARYKNAVRMPIGIDTDLFKPAVESPPRDAILFLGRLDEVKRPDVFLAALEILDKKGVRFHADMVGDPTYAGSSFAASIRRQAAPLIERGVLNTRGAIPHAETPAQFASHAIYVNLTPSGSFDKTIGEAMASGCLVIAANDAVKDVIADLRVEGDASDVARALERALTMTAVGAASAIRENRVYIQKEHSLALLMDRVVTLYSV